MSSIRFTVFFGSPFGFFSYPLFCLVGRSASTGQRQITKKGRFFMYSWLGFTGSRNITASHPAAIAVSLTAQHAQSLGYKIAVGCAKGTDSIVRNVAPAARVFSAASYAKSGHPAYALVRRSVAMVHHLVQQNTPLNKSVLIGFPAAACPAGITPAPRWQSGVTPSGAWSTLALAAGLGVPILVYTAAPATLPKWGAWSAVNFGSFTFYKLTPAATQAALF